MGAFDQAIPWSTNGAKGCRRFLDRVWKLQTMVTPEEGYSADWRPRCIRPSKRSLRTTRR